MALTIYTVQLRGELDAAEPDAVLVKEGFCWPALFVAPFWLLYRQQWLGLLAWFSGYLLIAAIGYLLRLDEFVSSLLYVAFAILFALHANDWRRWRLEAGGYRLIDVASGRRLDEAETGWFRRVAAERSVERPGGRTAGHGGVATPARSATPPSVPRPASSLSAIAGPFDPR